MKNWFVVLLFIFGKTTAQNVIVLDSFSQLERRLHLDSDTTFVVNFWATWCKPCVEELPLFAQLDSVFAQKPVKIVLVSLDFRAMLDKKLRPFLKTNSIKSEVALLADPDANRWIANVDATWDGAIPATLFLRKKKRVFQRVQFSQLGELKKLVEDVSKN